MKSGDTPQPSSPHVERPDDVDIGRPLVDFALEGAVVPAVGEPFGVETHQFAAIARRSRAGCLPPPRMSRRPVPASRCPRPASPSRPATGTRRRTPGGTRAPPVARDRRVPGIRVVPAEALSFFHRPPPGCRSTSAPICAFHLMFVPFPASQASGRPIVVLKRRRGAPSRPTSASPETPTATPSRRRA